MNLGNLGSQREECDLRLLELIVYTLLNCNSTMPYKMTIQNVGRIEETWEHKNKEYDLRILRTNPL